MSSIHTDITFLLSFKNKYTTVFIITEHNYIKVLGVTHNHKLCYFESFDGASIREVMASETDPIHSVDVSPCGLYIVTGGGDRQVKVKRKTFIT